MKHFAECSHCKKQSPFRLNSPTIMANAFLSGWSFLMTHPFALLCPDCSEKDRFEKSNQYTDKCLKKLIKETK